MLEIDVDIKNEDGFHWVAFIFKNKKGERMSIGYKFEKLSDITSGAGVRIISAMLRASFNGFIKN